MKKPSKRDSLNLFFSAFLVLAFIVCAHFFTQITSTFSPVAGSVINIALYTVFGLLLFYATRVGDGKAVKRFSLVTLIVMVLPSLYIVIASLAPGMPFYDVFSAGITGKTTLIVSLAAVALGYSIPYTFISGFEVEQEEQPAESDEAAFAEDEKDENDNLSPENEESPSQETPENEEEKSVDEETNEPAES